MKTVPESHIQAIEGFVSRQVWGLVQLQLLTGARGGELLRLRPIDIDTSGKVWTATLAEHKTSYQGRERTIYFGARAQTIFREFFQERPLHTYFFSPAEANGERHADAPSHRRENQKTNNRKTKRTVGDYYTPDSYRNAIKKACVKAEVPEWSPHRLRHNAATRFRKEYGLEVAQVILGHATADITQVYAERDAAKAIEVIERIG